jgi:general secretion pathway protein D
LVYLRLFAIILLTGGLLPGGWTAYRHFLKAEKAQAKGDFVKAYAQYAQAVALDPNNTKYWAHMQAVRSGALQTARVSLPPVPALESTLDEALPDLPEDSSITARLLPPPELKPKPGRQDFDLSGDPRKLFEQAAKAFGLECVFDSDYPPAGASQRFRLQDADARLALYALETITGSFVVPINERAFLVGKDTTQKRQELEATMAVTIPIPEGTTPQDIQELGNAVRTAFDLTKVGFDTARRQIVLRDRVSRLRPAVALLDQLMAGKASVYTEVEFLSVDKNSNLNAGLRMQTSFPLAAFGDYSPSKASIPTGFNTFFLFGGGASLLGLGVADVTLYAALTHGRSYTLVKTGMLSMDGQPAMIHLGDRYPIITQGYYGDTGGSTGQVYAPPPTVQFEDLGTVVKLTPHVQGTDEVTLEVEAEYKALSGQSSNGIPVIANRKLTTRVTLRFDQVAVVGGLIDETISQSWSGNIPFVRVPFLRENTSDKRRSDVVLVIRPRLVSLPSLSPSAGKPMWVGTETRLLSPIQ